MVMKVLTGERLQVAKQLNEMSDDISGAIILLRAPGSSPLSTLDTAIHTAKDGAFHILVYPESTKSNATDHDVETLIHSLDEGMVAVDDVDVSRESMYERSWETP